VRSPRTAPQRARGLPAPASPAGSPRLWPCSARRPRRRRRRRPACCSGRRTRRRRRHRRPRPRGQPRRPHPNHRRRGGRAAASAPRERLRGTARRRLRRSRRPGQGRRALGRRGSGTTRARGCGGRRGSSQGPTWRPHARTHAQRRTRSKQAFTEEARVATRQQIDSAVSKEAIMMLGSLSMAAAALNAVVGGGVGWGGWLCGVSGIDGDVRAL